MKLKSYILLLLVGVLVLSAVYFLASRAYISVAVQSSDGGEYVYTLYNQDSRKTTTFKSTSPNLKRLLPTGAYEVTVRHDTGYYFSVVDNGRFFGTTNVDAGLSGEKARSFVGNNPKSCLHIADDVLLSIPCGDTAKNLQLHRPATATLATYTSKSTTPLDGFVESMFTIGNSNYALIKSPEVGEDQGAPHSLYVLNKEGNLTAGKAMLGLIDSQTYAAEPYRQGILVYSLDGEQVLYYPSVGSQPVEINIDKPKTSGLTFNTLSVQDDAVMLTYSANRIQQIPGSRLLTDEEILPEDSNVDGADLESEVVIYKDNQTTSYPLKGTIETARVCGSANICVLDNGVVQVYSTSANELEPVYKISGVESIESSPGGLLLVRSDGILNLDVDSKSGSLDYTFGKYDYCGVTRTATGYIACVTNSKGTDAALRINQNATDTDSIDKKVAELLDEPKITDVSIYGNSIFISPNVGELVYNPAIKGYTYSPESKKTAAEAISRKVTNLQIDTNRYRVVSTIR